MAYRASKMVAKITNVTNSKICALVFTPDGKHAVAADERCGVRRWNIRDAQQVGPTLATTGHVLSVAVSKDAQWIVTGDTEKQVVVWNAASHEKVLVISEWKESVWAVDVASDSMRVAAGGKKVRIFSTTSGAELITPMQHESSVMGIKFSPTGDRIATTAYMCASIRVYDSSSGKMLFDIPVPVPVQAHPVAPLSWSPDGYQLFSGSPGRITCLDTSTSAFSEWPVHDEDPGVCIVAHEKFIACSAGNSVSFWDTGSRKQIGRVLGHASKIQGIALALNEGRLACGNGNTISLYRLTEILPEIYPAPPVYLLPLMEVSFPAVKSWKEDDTKRTEAILSDEIKVSGKRNHHALAHRALIRARLKQWSTALEDADMSLEIRLSSIGHITKALALVASGDKNLALSEFDFAFSTCDQEDIKFLLVVKSIVSFESGNHADAIFRISGLVPDADPDIRYCAIQVLGNMYLKKGDYEGAVRSLQDAHRLTAPDEIPELTTVSFIFGWSFDGIEDTAWMRLCESLHAAGRIKEVGEALVELVDSLVDEDREAVSCGILEKIIMVSGEVTLLSWSGKSSSYNSCLPAFPSVYTKASFTLPTLEGVEMESRTMELRTSLPKIDALIIHDWVTRIQPVRFANCRLHLPCLPFRLQSLSKNETNTYRAKVTWLGELEFTTDDTLPLDAPRRLVFVHPWIRRLGDTDGMVTFPDGSESEGDTSTEGGTDSDSASDVEIDAKIMHAPIVEEAPPAPLDRYTRALQLIARLGQPFNALLLLKQEDGTYKWVAAENEIVVRV